MTGDLVRAMRACPQPIIAAVEGVCAGAGAIIAMASDIRFAQPGAQDRVPVHPRRPVSGADMGACAILPRIIGHGRAAELLFTGRDMTTDEGFAWGFYNRVVRRRAGRSACACAAISRAGRRSPTAVTKRQLDAEWNVSIDEALEDGSAGAGAVHGDQRFPPRLRGVRQQAERRCSRATDADRSKQLPRLALFRGAPSRAGSEARRLVPGDDPRRRSRPIRTTRAARRSTELGQGGLPEAVRRRRQRIGPTCAASPSAARPLRAITAWSTSPSRCRASAPARSRCSERSSRSANGCREVASGEAIAAFAMTEPECGSDAANMSTSAMRDGNEWVLVGEKTYISNGGIADFYVTFARTGEGEGARGLSAFIVPADVVEVAERIEVIAPHPLARLEIRQCPHSRRRDHRRAGRGLPHRHGDAEPVPGDRRRGGARASRGARSTKRSALRSSRRLGSGTLADNAVTQAKLADMALAIDASALLIYRAAWQQDVGRDRSIAARRRWPSSTRPKPRSR